MDDNDNHNVDDDDDDDGRKEVLYNRPKKSHKRFDLILFSSAIVKGGRGSFMEMGRLH